MGERSLDKYLTPYVTSNHRSAYVNYVYVWMGQNNPTRSTSYAQTNQQGKRNFDKLVFVLILLTSSDTSKQSIPVVSLLSGIYKLELVEPLVLYI